MLPQTADDYLDLAGDAAARKKKGTSKSRYRRYSSEYRRYLLAGGGRLSHKLSVFKCTFMQGHTVFVELCALSGTLTVCPFSYILLCHAVLQV